jgi:hypothetical protein
MRSCDVPQKYQRLYEKAQTGKSRRAGIRCHCLMCVGWRAKDLELCTATECPLYPYRMKVVPKSEMTSKARNLSCVKGYMATRQSIIPALRVRLG